MLYPVWLPTFLRKTTKNKEKMKKQTKEVPKMATESDSVFQVVSQKSPN